MTYNELWNIWEKCKRLLNQTGNWMYIGVLMPKRLHEAINLIDGFIEQYGETELHTRTLEEDMYHEDNY